MEILTYIIIFQHLYINYEGIVRCKMKNMTKTFFERHYYV